MKNIKIPTLLIKIALYLIIAMDTDIRSKNAKNTDVLYEAKNEETKSSDHQIQLLISSLKKETEVLINTFKYMKLGTKKRNNSKAALHNLDIFDELNAVKNMVELLNEQKMEAIQHYIEKVNPLLDGFIDIAQTKSCCIDPTALSLIVQIQRLVASLATTQINTDLAACCANLDNAILNLGVSVANQIGLIQTCCTNLSNQVSLNDSAIMAQLTDLNNSLSSQVTSNSVCCTSLTDQISTNDAAILAALTNLNSVTGQLSALADCINTANSRLILLRTDIFNGLCP
jgi:hypothetical protein